ncbi:1-deoxy-D-xylulose-5-phosphate synthase [Bifidobacterium margollesii]|uniref:1-deoxy-D-xylulose-5-phosphate synthase n=1 Tax=Bifidobacterium margollesii TaxID=2020964 RepID=A0A2N5J7U7_9BIFI|nr:1-deoxy-D-xylulose-5-phosphate synthase [Bifidobacterium margollesii]PLS30283.1 1-deoxy-D-xylulose-5-phosphate synthase [Bifidobacterium margollesii]
MSDYLAHIDGTEDLKRLAIDQLPDLADEVRRALLEYCEVHGGHVGSNLGIVEATIALHYVFDSPRDHIVFDVSHQSYTHKMLTGRRRAFTDPRLYGTVTGFTNPLESEDDPFVLGHTGTSISLACGMARARDLTGGTNRVVAVIGDGSLSSAVAFEGLNEAGELHGNLLIVVNDNEMSIAENHGGMYANLARLRATGGLCEHNLFRDFGLDYRYVEHGNDVTELVKAFREVRDFDHPVVVHIHTVKGLGLGPDDEGRVESNHWHNAASAAGRPLGARKTYGMMAMDMLAKRFDTEPGLIVISPATPGSNGITREFRAEAGSHYLDTGITEEHAVALAAGIGRAEGTPVLATSATFFQRAFDQIHQEFALNRVPGTLLIFGGGISGTDNTHSGAGDVVMFGNIPGLTCLAPTSGAEFLSMLAWSTGPARRPVAIRVPGEAVLSAERAGGYPRYARAGVSGINADDRDDDNADAASSAATDTAATATDTVTDAVAGDPLRYRITHRGREVALIGLGNAYPLAESAAGLLAEHDIDATVINPRQYSSLDEETLIGLEGDHRIVVTVEDGQLEGGWGEKITAFYANRPANEQVTMQVLNVGASKEVTDRVPMTTLRERYGLTAERIAGRVLGRIR